MSRIIAIIIGILLIREGQDGYGWILIISMVLGWLINRFLDDAFAN